MTSWSQAVVQPDASLSDVIAAIERGGIQICFVLDRAGVLQGTITDGDVRRGILGGASLDTAAHEVMNVEPVASDAEASRSVVHSLMQAKRVRQVPLLDPRGRVVDVVLDEYLRPTHRDNIVVLMAGGLGSRLGELTKDTPKPLLDVGGKPILETILETFIENGFRRFYMSINYLGEQVVDYFGDGGRWGVDIDYLRETEPLGTAGALSLLPERPEHPFFVMNGDILTRANFAEMLEFHSRNKAAATVAVREYDIEIPFGVVELDGSRVRTLVEKPVHRSFVNAGIYIIDPTGLDRVPSGTFYDMPTLLRSLLGADESVVSFPLHEYWLDIGRIHEYRRANQVYSEVFGARLDE